MELNKKSGSLSAADFFEKLQHDELSAVDPFYITGMVKKSEGKEKTLDFAPGGNCAHWVTIPLEYIEEVEMIKTIPCKDHAHPLVKLHLKEPKTPEGKTFFALLSRVKEHEVHSPTSGDDGATQVMAKNAGPSHGSGKIIYKRKCHTEQAWICDMNGCRWIPQLVCIDYPVRV